MSKLINKIREYKIKLEGYTQTINEKDIQIKTLLSKLSKLKNKSNESLMQKNDMERPSKKRTHS